MKVLKTTVSFLAATLVFASCTRDENPVQVEDQAISQEVIEKVESLALNPKGMTLETFVTPDGTTESVYMVEGDIAIYPEQLANMSIYDGITSEQYRTRNLVSQPRTISVIGYTGGANALTTNMQTGLALAINNYNALNLTLTFTLTFATSTAADIVVYVDPAMTSASVGASGFPSNGNPFKWVRLSPSLDNFPMNVIECVITHEIGHSIGLRHTDWFSRQSCGQYVNEGDAGVGAIHIPGTPTGFDPTSIMLSCCSLNTDGELNANDITALRFLY
ncbi:M57 family metalloprotease [Ascidiimonas aurantiaca]|uniref:M57 family metalloprotease n=1 Tax=Ascidiimonas aurantiaca TaxID=1685432 RepID=UPI0030ED42F6